MTLGPSFAHEDALSKALRKVRTIAGVKFFGQPIGTVISPGMVRVARERHGDKKVDAMLVSQQRNTRRDARQSHFQNQSLVRAKKREERVTANAAHRDRVARDKSIREMEANRRSPAAAYLSRVTPSQEAPKTAPKAAAPAAPAVVPSKTTATNKDLDTLFDLVHAQDKWTEDQVGKAIELAMKLKATADPQVRELLMALIKRLQKEE